MQQETKSCTMQAHAKINLTLDVSGRRADGYHLVEMVMQTVALHDTVTVRWCAGQAGIRLFCGGAPLPEDAGNLAYRAAALFYQTTGCPIGTTEITIEKRIPIAAGLAGGSTDAAAVLRALDTLHGTALGDARLCEIGLTLGADVPYCLLGGTRLAEGIGEKLRPLPSAPPCAAVLCKPSAGVSTKEIYEAIDTAPTLRHPDTAAMCRALAAGDLAAVCAALENVMEPITAQRVPEVEEIRRVLLECGACGARMSGSGPTVFGLFADAAQAAQAATRLAPRFADTHLTALWSPEV